MYFTKNYSSYEKLFQKILLYLNKNYQLVILIIFVVPALNFLNRATHGRSESEPRIQPQVGASSVGEFFSPRDTRAK